MDHLGGLGRPLFDTPRLVRVCHGRRCERVGVGVVVPGARLFPCLQRGRRRSGGKIPHGTPPLDDGPHRPRRDVSAPHRHLRQGRRHRPAAATGSRSERPIDLRKGPADAPAELERIRRAPGEHRAPAGARSGHRSRFRFHEGRRGFRDVARCAAGIAGQRTGGRTVCGDRKSVSKTRRQNHGANTTGEHGRTVVDRPVRSNAVNQNESVPTLVVGRTVPVRCVFRFTLQGSKPCSK
mmetsp:Transcript_2658/g.5752  ORF Transcript_2658/g.5752 Transcript_2658/m.5752 type:complete len:237 (-) Transcript_2658:55-765(-)